MVLPTILKDKLIAIPFAMALVVLVVAFSYVYVNFADFQGLLIVHFDSYRGADFLGDPGDVFGILGVALAVLAINGFIADELYWRERFLSHVIAYGSAFFSLLILIAVLVIISVN